MTFGISGAALAGIAVAGATVYSANKAAGSARDAMNAQTAAGQQGIAEQQRQFDAMQKLLSPYVTAGNAAMSRQQDLLGVNGTDAQQKAIEAIQSSPAFTSQLKLGENSILANGSATGNLRGGNVQAALAQFSPTLLAQSINDQYSRLGGMTSLGQNAAAGVGNAGMQTGNNVSSLMQQIGAAQAGGALAQGRSATGVVNGLANGFGMYGALMNGFGGSYTTPNAFGAYANPSAGSGGVGIDPNGFLGGASTAGDFSDIRLKTDIERIGTAGNGLPLYSFRYVWGGPKRTGHMAHEVATKFPEAVSTHESGFLMVDYSKV